MKSNYFVCSWDRVGKIIKIWTVTSLILLLVPAITFAVGFSNASLKGPYYIGGYNSIPGDTFTHLMQLSFDGIGSFTGSETRKDASGVVSSESVSGTYSVNADGTFTVTTGGGSPETMNGRLSYDAKILVISRMDSSTVQVFDIGVKAAPAGFSSNTFRGYFSGGSNTTGTGNAFYGYSAGLSNTTGYKNTFVGNEAGYSNTEGYGNNFIGNYAGRTNTAGAYNVFQGNSAGYANTTGNYNSFFGTLSGRSNTIGYANTFIGFSAGNSNISGYGNVFLGYNAGYNETGSNKLYIANSNTATPLIYGNFATSIVNINGKLGIGTNSPSYPIQTAGGAYVTVGGVWTNASSRELKNNIQRLKIEDAVKTLQGLNPVTFTYKTSPEESHVGFIAEDVPELVATKDRKGLSSMDVVSVLTKVVQEQQALIGQLQKKQALIEEQQKIIVAHSQKIAELEQLLTALKTVSRLD